MNRNIISLLAFCIFTSFLAGCGPARKEMLEYIESNETAFLLNIEGNSKENQDMFRSAEYLNTLKIAAKQVTLAQRKKGTGRWWFSYEWIPTQRLYKVDRSPVTREWTAEEKSGTNQNNEAIYVEDESGIGFAVGINITASVQEADTATYLYNYAEKDLDIIIDANVRGFITSVLSREFASLPLQDCVKQKRRVSESLETETKDRFKKKGITIEYLGIAEGLTFENMKIQNAIDARYEAEVDVMTAAQEKLAQDKRNEMKVAIAQADREAAEEFEKALEAAQAKIKVEALLTMAEQWDGQLPNYLIMGQGGSDLSMFLPAPATVNERVSKAVRAEKPDRSQNTGSQTSKAVTENKQ